jgi:hypothetical protein
MFKNCRALALTIILFVSLAIQAEAELLSRAQSESQARGFLQLLDQGLQDESWQTMSAAFQSLNDRAYWKTRQQVIRTSYGTLEARDLKHISYRKTFSLSPDGEYIIVQFRSNYQNRAETIETVVLDCSGVSECSVRHYVIQ